MKNFLTYLDGEMKETIQRIGEEAQEKGYRAYLVGGIVRDLILQRPNGDLDIVVEGNGLELAQSLSRQRNASLIMHKQFGTATIIFPNNLRVDIATARKEMYPHSGSLPVVTEGSIHEDLFRRDFTINAMAIAITPSDWGKLVDFYGGGRDIRAKAIRVLHPLSFRDDPTRILRAVRFEQRLNFRLEPQSLRWLKEAVHENVIRNVKPERFFDEFRKILLEQNPEHALWRLERLKSLKFLGNKIRVDSSTLRLLKTISSKKEEFIQKFSPRVVLEIWLVYMMAMVQKVKEPQVKKILVEFNFRRQDREKVLTSLQTRKIFMRLSSTRLLPSQIYQLLKPFSYETLFFFQRKASALRLKRRIEDFFTRYDPIRLTITGNDLMVLGVPSGERIGRILEEVRYAKINGKVASPQEELDLAKKLMA